ncbi:MAG TPA: hypothetical protein VEC11_05215 [Allosphingosinicella sp.]|nr:hypothetical protein [Allosphingosinicella sp.]
MVAAGQPEAREPEPPDTTCLWPPDRSNFTEFSTPVFRQGATIGIRAKRDQMPAGYRDLPAECLSGWSIEGPAELSADRRSLTIRPDAPPGSEIILRYNVKGEPVLARLRVVARDAVVLTGRWGQRAAAGCESLDPVRELEFGPERFSVTFTPFESYKDYWGSYSFDPQTGALRLTVTGGNRVPSGLDLEGTARIEDGHLVLEGLFLGDRSGRVPEGGCRYRF